MNVYFIKEIRREAIQPLVLNESTGENRLVQFGISDYLPKCGTIAREEV